MSLFASPDERRIYHLRPSEASPLLNCGIEPRGRHVWMQYECEDMGLVVIRRWLCPYADLTLERR